jgi:hypothetical protein
MVLREDRAGSVAAEAAEKSAPASEDFASPVVDGGFSREIGVESSPRALAHRLPFRGAERRALHDALRGEQTT